MAEPGRKHHAEGHRRPSQPKVSNTVDITEAWLKSYRLPAGVTRARWFDSRLRGFAVVIGKTGASFYVQRRLNGKQGIITIGRWLDKLEGDGDSWTVKRARDRAEVIIGRRRDGVGPESRRTPDDVVTLSAALALHLKAMEDNGKRPISITTVRYDVERLLADYLDKPLAVLTVEEVQAIKEAGRQHKTQTNRLLAHISAIWNTTRRLRRSTFAGENPVGIVGVQKYALSPERPRLQEIHMPEWLRRVRSLPPLRADIQLVALFTGMRDSNVTALRWDTIDWDRGGVSVPVSKTTAFTVPLCETVMEILKRRKDENAVKFAAYGGDGGWVFPTLTLRKPYKVIKVTETKERARDTVPWEKHGPKLGAKPKPGKKRVLFLPGLHALRRTFLSIAHECHVSKLDQHVLSNHAFGGDVHDDYIRQEFGHLHECVTRIEKALWARLQKE